MSDIRRRGNIRSTLRNTPSSNTFHHNIVCYRWKLENSVSRLFSDRKLNAKIETFEDSEFFQQTLILHSIMLEISFVQPAGNTPKVNLMVRCSGHSKVESFWFPQFLLKWVISFPFLELCLCIGCHHFSEVYIKCMQFKLSSLLLLY